MATFAYKVMDARGKPATGQVEGESKVVAAAALRSRGLTVVDLDEIKRSLAQIDIMEPFQTVKSKDLTIFSRQFATMVNSGLSMLRCLYVLEEQTPNKKLVKVIAALKDDVEAGISLSDALEKHPKVFSRLYVSMVRAGELGGILDEVLNRLATQLEKDDSIKRAVKSAMVYPIMIVLVRRPRAHRDGAVPHPRVRQDVQGTRQRQSPRAHALHDGCLPCAARLLVHRHPGHRAAHLGDTPSQAYVSWHRSVGPRRAAPADGHRAHRAEARR